MNTELYEKYVDLKLKEFNQYSFRAYGISGVLILNFIFRQYFNLRALNSNSITLDYFIMIDLIFAIFSGIVYSYINAHDAKSLIDK